MSTEGQAEVQRPPSTSISGELEDVSLLDIMQFIHHGLRSGILELEDGAKKANVRFSCGRIVNASAPDAASLGQRLLDASLIDPESLRDSLTAQKSDDTGRPLGSILLARQIVPKEALQEALTEQVEDTVRQLLQWSKGSFAFKLEDHLSVEGEPEPELRAQISLDTQAILLECLQIIDERAASNVLAEPPVRERTPAPAPDSELDFIDQQLRALEVRELGSEAEAVEVRLPASSRTAVSRPLEPVAARYQLLSEDDRLFEDLSRALASHGGGHLVGVGLRDAGAALPGEAPPILLVDVRAITQSQLTALRRRRPRVALVAISDAPLDTASLYAAGATVVERSDPETLTACLASLATQRGKALLDITESHLFSTSMAKLRRALVELRSGLLSSTVALNLLHFLAESVERAVLFLVRPDTLEVIGGFGFNNGSDRPLADLSRGMSLRRDESSALSSSINDGQAYSVTFDECGLPSEFVDAIGRPASGQSVIVPIAGRSGVLCVVYTDNGTIATQIENIEIFDLVTTQLGMAFENELLLRRLAKLEGTS